MQMQQQLTVLTSVLVDQINRIEKCKKNKSESARALLSLKFAVQSWESEQSACTWGLIENYLVYYLLNR